MRQLPDNNTLIDRYYAYLLLERGLSANTAEAYREDVRKLTGFAEAEGLNLNEIVLADLQHFASAIYDLGISPRSLARIISVTKSFFKWLKSEN